MPDNRLTPTLFARYVLLFLCLLVFTIAKGQDLSQTELKADLSQLKTAIETYHASYQLYTPDFPRKADSLIATIKNESYNPVQAFQAISKLCALSNEAHFALGNWNDNAHKGFKDNTFKYLPISVKILDGHMYAWQDYSSEQVLERGDEILAINGQSIASLLEDFYEAYPTDGNIKAYSDKIFEEGFAWLYYVYIDQPDSYVFQIKTTSGTSEKSIQAVTRDKQVENYGKFYPKKESEPTEEEGFYHLMYEGRTAMLTLTSFDRSRLEKYGIKPAQMYKLLFDEFKDKAITNLIIDLRGNTGGRNEMADELVPYILKENVDAAFLKRTISWEGKTRTFKMPKAAKNLFQGQMIVLVDVKTYSAANTFARYAKEFAEATIIGTETGTRYEGFAAGSKQHVMLTNSQIDIGIPRYLIEFPASTKQTTQNHGLIPDIVVPNTIESILQNKDPQMEKAKSMISGE